MNRPSVRVPELLNRLVKAGQAGIPLDGSENQARDLQLLRASGIPVAVDATHLMLRADSDLIAPEWLQSEVALSTWDRVQVFGFLEAGSTNEEAAVLARQGAETGTVVYAEKQTAGKGRLGHTWFSPPGSGVYLSIVLRPGRPTEFWPLLSLAASVALVNALLDVWGRRLLPPPRIELKWPNDVLIRGRKTAGILVEAARYGTSAFVILGCGINVAGAAVPPGLESQATAVAPEFGFPVPRRSMAAKFLTQLQEFWGMFEAGEDDSILGKYKAVSSIWNESPIWVIEGDSRRPAVTFGLAPTGGLRIRTESGTEETLLAAEVSIRKQS
jgi:BirA family biotin operon repressor/biotin-[acetyl-CoA-carboxylase] ligase